MIRARMDLKGGKGLLIGLTRENVARLLAGEPIVFDQSCVGLPPMTVAIMAGDSEQAIVDALGDAVGPDTELRTGGGERPH